jgi:hypothetical protein
MCLFLRDKRVYHNGDKQVQEDLRDDHLEAYEVEAGGPGGAAPVRYHAVLLDGFEGGVFLALEGDGVGAGCVKHEGIPPLSRGTPHQ